MDSKDLSVYITRITAGEITDHLVMSKTKTLKPKFRGEWPSPKIKNTDQYGKYKQIQLIIQIFWEKQQNELFRQQIQK